MLSRYVPRTYAGLGRTWATSAYGNSLQRVVGAHLSSLNSASTGAQCSEAQSNVTERKAQYNTVKQSYSSSVLDVNSPLNSPFGVVGVSPLPSDKVEELKMNNIIKSIDQFDTKEKIYFAPKAADALAKARLGNFKLDTQRLLKGIYACGLCARDMKTFELAFWAFDILKRENAANVEAFEAMMNICSKYGRVDSSVDLMRDFFARGYVYTSYLLSTYIIILANNGTPLQVRDLLHPLYTTYKVCFIVVEFEKLAHKRTCLLSISGSVEAEALQNELARIYGCGGVLLPTGQRRGISDGAAGPNGH